MEHLDSSILHIYMKKLHSHYRSSAVEYPAKYIYHYYMSAFCTKQYIFSDSFSLQHWQKLQTAHVYQTSCWNVLHSMPAFKTFLTYVQEYDSHSLFGWEMKSPHEQEEVKRAACQHYWFVFKVLEISLTLTHSRVQSDVSNGCFFLSILSSSRYFLRAFRQG